MAAALGAQEGRRAGVPKRRRGRGQDAGDARGPRPTPFGVAGGSLPLPGLWMESGRVKLEPRGFSELGGGPRLLFYGRLCRAA